MDLFNPFHGKALMTSFVREKIVIAPMPNGKDEVQMDWVKFLI